MEQEQEVIRRLNKTYRRINALKNEREKLVQEKVVQEKVAQNDIKGSFLQKFEEFKLLREKLIGDVRKEFPALIMPLMNMSDRIQSISWTQYTPYFADGDPCEFSTNYEYLDVNGKYSWTLFRDEAWGEADQNVVKNIQEAMRVIPDEIYKDVFGDHARITVSKDGTMTVESHEHD